MTTPRPLRPVMGGTRARDVDALRSALAALLADTGADVGSVGTAGADVAAAGATEVDGAAAGATRAAVAGAGTASADPANPANPADPADPAGHGRTRGPVLVPVAPGEDAAALLARIDAAGPLPPAADLVLRTSGSTTGSSALIAISAAALTASARAAHERLGAAGTWVLALPAHHIAGLQVLTRSLVAGTSPVVVDASAGFDPGALAAGLARALERGGPVHLSLVPTQLLRALDDAAATAALARADAVLLGGAAADPGLLARSRAAGIRVVTTYGMSETGGGCVYDGVPLGGVSLRIESPDASGAGRIVVAGPVLAEARLDGGASSAFSARASSSTSSFFARDGALRELITSDRGRLLPDGRLEVLGRLDDVIVTGGVKVEPADVEAVLSGLEGVARACVVGVPDGVWGSAVVAVVVPQAGVRLDARTLRASARARLDGVHSPKRVLVVDDLPLRGPGKVDRREVARLAAAAGRCR